MARYSDDYVNEPMYNADLKEQYISERDKEVVMPSNYLRCQFSKIAEMENELEKDASNFTTYEIEEYYKLLNTSSYDGLVVLNSQLSLYTQWCLQQNIVKDNQNHYLEMDTENIRGCVNKALFEMQFVTKETVYKWCDDLPNSRDSYYVLAVFEGLKNKNFKDLWSLRPCDIKGNVATLWNGRKVELSNKLINIIDNCVTEDTYYSISGKGEKVMKLLDLGYIAKSYPNVKDFDETSDFQKSRQVFNALTRVFDYFGVLGTMSINSLFISGMLEMIRELAKEHNMTCKELIYSSYITQVENRYGKIVKSVFCTKYENQLNCLE